MIKHFCDSCGAEITEKTNGSRLLSEKDSIAVKLTLVEPIEVPMDEELPEYCKYCLLDIIKQLDDRPRHVSGNG